MHSHKYNSSGCKDLTAYEAINNIEKPDNVVKYLIKTIKRLADICGFEIIGRIGLKHKFSGKVYR